MKKQSTEDFITKCKRTHGDRYCYDHLVYIHAKEKINILCKDHGEFLMTPNNHLYGKQGCPGCGREGKRKTQQQFLNDATAVHGKLYDYSESKYVNNKIKIKIICGIHGEFFQTPDQHTNSGTGCPRCTYDNRVGGYSEDFFQLNPHCKNLGGLLYLVQVIGSTETFYKIGITRRTVSSRFSGYPYAFSVICTQALPIYNAFLLEQQIIKRLEGYRFVPSVKFKGWTECFRLDRQLIKECTELFVTKDS